MPSLPLEVLSGMITVVSTPEAAGMVSASSDMAITASNCPRENWVMAST